MLRFIQGVCAKPSLSISSFGIGSVSKNKRFAFFEIKKYEDYIETKEVTNDKSKSPKAAPKTDEAMLMLKKELKIQ